MLFILIDSFHHAQAKAPEIVEEASKEESLEPIHGHPTWSDGISIGLVNSGQSYPAHHRKGGQLPNVAPEAQTPISKRILVNIII